MNAENYDILFSQVKYPVPARKHMNLFNVFETMKTTDVKLVYYDEKYSAPQVIFKRYADVLVFIMFNMKTLEYGFASISEKNHTEHEKIFREYVEEYKSKHPNFPNIGPNKMEIINTICKLSKPSQPIEKKKISYNSNTNPFNFYIFL